MSKDYIARGLSILAAAITFVTLIVVLSTPRPNYSSAVTVPIPDKAPKALIDLDCNRPQGHHVWTGEMITPQDDDVMRVSTGDNVEDIKIHGWLCVIAPHYPKID